MATKEPSETAAGKDELVKRGMLSSDDGGRALAERFGMEVLDTLPLSALPRSYYEKVSYAFAKKNLVLPIAVEEETVIVAINDPLHLEPLEEIRIILGLDVRAVFAPKEIILHAIQHFYNQEKGAASQLIADLRGDSEDLVKEGEIESYDLLDRKLGQSPIIKLLNLILTEAIQQGASDIHFEPGADGLKVRYRIDGVLQSRHAPSQEFQAPLLTRIKVMAKLDIAEHRLPQDGRIKLKMGPREIDFRVSTVPVVGGERIVLRILDKGNVVLGLDKIGMLPEVLEEFQKLISLPEGIILVTGPTGSGKTTTLYSAICEMADDEINIMTVEDPVEYNLKGIAQIAVRHKIGLSFASGLRHILRQDPDVVMIGEIRDAETAEISIQASLTGHLVLSTLHTNDAPSAITRLVDMGIEPYLLSSSIAGVLAQRLVRTICNNCKRRVEPTLREVKSIGLKESELNRAHFSEGAGCERCYGSGYRGRHGIYELMVVNNVIHKQIVTSPDAIELRRLALESGMVSLLAHGAELVRQGVTTIAEVLRATRGVEGEG
ncbi:General secretion pathway protein E [Estrella lausannensis]|uniref:protein-secreting ATPase n=2 Tax=Estrella lausannensis TaxID=483423 RepID=A0A0H5DMQ0_9BACT|nr:type II secretion system ATPase GspE [Estrella lausannensis]CRX37416.1 General secretion pathway protein E [Estrella lausannensis]